MSKLFPSIERLRCVRRVTSRLQRPQCAATVLAAVCVAAIAPATFAADFGTLPKAEFVATNYAATTEASLPFDARRLGLIRNASDLIGEKVTDSRHKNLGRIHDLVLDISSGGLVAALVDSGGRTPITPVPACSFGETSTGKPQLIALRKLFQIAPRFAGGRFVDRVSPSDLSDSFSYFGQPAPRTAAPGPGFETASALFGQPVAGRSGETLGHLRDIVVDLTAGRAVFLVIQPAAGLENTGDYYLVPPASVQPDAACQALVLNADRAHFLSGHHYPKEFPTAINLPQVAVAVYGHYGLLISAPNHAALRSNAERRLQPTAATHAPAQANVQTATGAL